MVKVKRLKVWWIPAFLANQISTVELNKEQSNGHHGQVQWCGQRQFWWRAHSAHALRLLPIDTSTLGKLPHRLAVHCGRRSSHPQYNTITLTEQPSLSPPPPFVAPKSWNHLRNPQFALVLASPMIAPCRGAVKLEPLVSFVSSRP